MQAHAHGHDLGTRGGARTAFKFVGWPMTLALIAGYHINITSLYTPTLTNCLEFVQLLLYEILGIALFTRLLSSYNDAQDYVHWGNGPEADRAAARRQGTPTHVVGGLFAPQQQQQQQSTTPAARVPPYVSDSDSDSGPEPGPEPDLDLGPDQEAATPAAEIERLHLLSGQRQAQGQDQDQTQQATSQTHSQRPQAHQDILFWCLLYMHHNYSVVLKALLLTLLTVLLTGLFVCINVFRGLVSNLFRNDSTSIFALVFTTFVFYVVCIRNRLLPDDVYQYSASLFGKTTPAATHRKATLTPPRKLFAASS